LHLDLKPETVILSDEGTPDERVTVIDFGIARLKELPGRPLRADAKITSQIG
jgi:serine/threonine protein kinase